MNLRIVVLLLAFIVTAGPGIIAQSASFKSPDEFLEYKHGSRFTPHHLLVGYFSHVAEASERVHLVEYGQTYELRPLIAVIVSSPENIRRYDEIRMNNLRRTGLQPGNVTDDNIAIIYLSYSVHGNEAAGSESAMSVLYALAKGGTDIDKWLANTVVIIDPSLNPDGYSRYSQWSNSVSADPFNANPETREHDEPWPGGRTNHYYFDLNRDWAWQTQKETQERMAFYLSWMPHVHADLHEMFGESTYYFAPAAKPYHPYLSTWQAEFQNDIGRNHASHFDREGWRYFTKEFFDLFYPGYGDTYPMLSGAIGMTYEQSGHGASGRAQLLRNGDTLKLADRIAHHYTTSLSTVEIASKNSSALVKEFHNYFKSSISNPGGHFKSYIIKNSSNTGRIYDLLKLLDRNQIRYGVLGSDQRSVKGFSYKLDGITSFTPEKGDIIIPVAQPRSALLNALFEPESVLADSLTYDITAWSLPMAYGLSTYATTEVFDIIPYKAHSNKDQSFTGTPYGYALQWGSVPSARFLASLLKQGIVARYATEAFKVNGVSFEPGTVLFLKADNKRHFAFEEIMKAEIQSSVVPVSIISTGFVDEGKDLGSESYRIVRKPEILSITGEDVSSQSVGQVWHFFEEELNYPVNLIDVDRLDNVVLDNYNVLILPEGSYRMDAEFLKKLISWTRTGGQVIAIGSAVNLLAGKEGIALKSRSNEAEEKKPVEDPAHFPEAYDASIRKSVSSNIAGAIFQTVIDKSHPLTFGLGDSYWTLKTSPASYSWLPAGGNAIYLNGNPKYYGFAGSKALEKVNKTLIAGREQTGGGGIVYVVDNPLFRSFWNSGKVLFSNAVFF